MKEPHATLPTYKVCCGAKCKQHNHRPCRGPAMSNGRCRMHGGKTPIKHGDYTKSAIAERKEFRLFFNRMKAEAVD